MNRRVEGVYATVEEAMSAVQRLRDQGYSRNDIFLVANADVRNNIPYTMDAEVTTDTDAAGAGAGDDDRSLWEKIKDAFTVDDDYDASAYDHPDYDSSSDPLYAHRDDIANGNIVVMLDADATPAVSGAPGYASTPADDDDTGMIRRDTTGTMGTGINDITGDIRTGEPLHSPDTLGTDDVVGTRHDARIDLDRDRDIDLDRDETIELREEELDVDTRKVQTGEVRIGKRIVEETETVDVPVTHEEVTIERRPVTDRRAVDGDIDLNMTEEEIVIPVTEEQVQIDKHAEVVEEVDVRKEQFTDTKRVTETVRREELDVDSTGNVHVEGADVHHDHDVLDRDRDDRSLLEKGRDALDRDNDGKILDTDADRRTMDSDRGLLDNDPDRDRRI